MLHIRIQELDAVYRNPGTHLYIDNAPPDSDRENGVEVIVLDDNTYAYRDNTPEMDGDWKIGDAQDVAYAYTDLVDRYTEEE